MWQRFTERARRVVYYAQEEAKRFGEGYVSTEHMLLGLCRETDTVAARILERLGVSLNRIRAEVEKQLPKGSANPPQDMTLTPRAKRCIDLAYEEARLLGNNYIGTEHLLLGLVREERGVGGVVLKHIGVVLKTVREATIEFQTQEEDLRATDPEKSSVLKRLWARQTRIEAGYDGDVSPASQQIHADVHLLHPVDQLLLTLLSDKESVLGKGLLSRCPNLEGLLPSVVATMATTRRSGRLSLQGVLSEAQLLAAREKRHELRTEDLFLACVRHTTDDVRDQLTELGLNPF